MTIGRWLVLSMIGTVLLAALASLVLLGQYWQVQRSSQVLLGTAAVTDLSQRATSLAGTIRSAHLPLEQTSAVGQLVQHEWTLIQHDLITARGQLADRDPEAARLLKAVRELLTPVTDHLDEPTLMPFGAQVSSDSLADAGGLAQRIGTRSLVQVNKSSDRFQSTLLWETVVLVLLLATGASINVVMLVRARRMMDHSRQSLVAASLALERGEMPPALFFEHEPELAPFASALAEFAARAEQTRQELTIGQAALVQAESDLAAEANRAAQNRDLLESMLNSTQEGFILVAPDRTATLANRAAREFLGLPDGMAALDTQDVFRRGLAMVAEPAHLQSLLDRGRQSPHAPVVSEIEFVHGPRPGTYAYKAFPVYGRDQAFLGRALILRDITQERQLEAMRSDMIHTVSHEIRTPLSTVYGLSELLVHRHLPPEKQAELHGLMFREARRLQTLVDDFLDVQRLEAGAVRMKVEPVSLAEHLQEAAAVLPHLMDRHPLLVDVPPTLPAVWADPDRLAQVVRNLLTNAVKYSPCGGAIHLVAESVGAQVRIAVSDQGMGIAPADQARIFERFYRVGGPALAGIPGTGLGLAICKQLVEAMGGAIGVQSTPGEGSTFWLTLPACTAGASIPPAAGT